MAENDTDEVLHKFNELFDSHKNLTRDEISKIKRELTEALEGVRKEDKQEIEELRSALEEVNEWISDEKLSREQRDKVRKSRTTLVIPPDDTRISPPEPEETTAPATSEDDAIPTRQSLWKRFW